MKSHSKYIAFIDSDDIWKKNKLKIKLLLWKKISIFLHILTTKLLVKKDIVVPPKQFTFFDFIKNTSIATSTMVIKNKIAKTAKFTNTQICEDYFYKCSILKKTKYAYRLNQTLTKYRIRDGSHKVIM